MSLRLYSLTFDAADPEEQAAFWAAVTGYEITLSTEFVTQLGGDGSFGPGFMFIKVPEPKTAKNRMHFDLGTADLDAEVDRVVALGATLQSRHEEFGITWATLTDPEGNEFCIGLHP
jgi:predicted enzyme related to lactoylglutathione lyase